MRRLSRSDRALLNAAIRDLRHAPRVLGYGRADSLRSAPFSARCRGVCPRCRKRIDIGDDIRYHNDFADPVHVGCREPSARLGRDEKRPSVNVDGGAVFVVSGRGFRDPRHGLISMLSRRATVLGAVPASSGIASGAASVVAPNPTRDCDERRAASAKTRAVRTRSRTYLAVVGAAVLGLDGVVATLASRGAFSAAMPF